jgi:sugar phosphate isomerase/epimerase
MGELAEAAKTVGATYVVLPSAPSPADLDGYKRQAEEFNEIGASAAKYGLRFAYHNHGNGLKEINGKIPMELILQETDPKLVFFQMDLFWTAAGGIDSITWLKNYPGRYRSLHIKDMSKQVRFSGDGSNSSEWFELFPYLADAGSGVLDIKGILSQAQQAGVEHYFVERDLAPDPQEALRNAFRYLKS